MDVKHRLTAALDAALAWLEVKTLEAYRRQLWRAVLALYRGEIDGGEFETRWGNSIEEQLRRAWREGSREMGVKPEEWEEEDNQEIDRIILGEFDYVAGVSADVQAAASNNTGFEQFRSRIDIWANRYNDTVNRARVWFGGREKLVWVYGDTEHCETCAALNGIVAWAKEWELAGVRPQSPPNDALDCGGWHCQCMLNPTDARRTRNAFDRIMGAL